MTHYDLMDKANRLWWQTYERAVADCFREDPHMPDKEVDRRAMAIADKARKEFVEEARSFTAA